MRSPWCLYVCVCAPSPVNLLMIEPVFMKLGMYIMTPEPISIAYFVNFYHQSVCLYVYSLIVAMPRLGKNVTAATKTHATIEEFLHPSFFFFDPSLSFQKKVEKLLFPKHIVIWGGFVHFIKFCVCVCLAIGPSRISVLSYISTFYPLNSPEHILTKSLSDKELQAGGPGFYPRRSKSFLFSSQRPDRLWRPPSLLSNGYMGLLPQR
jgi:hypothetical protein